MAAGLALNHGFVWLNGQPVFEGGPARTPDPGILSRSHPPILSNATDSFLIFTDHLGTPILETNMAGQVAWRAEYEPYGSVYLMRAGARTDEPLRFPGQDLAMTWEGAEENYNVFRWYMAGWGRYTQVDPMLTNTMKGKVLSTHVADDYRYAASNPVRFLDPKGLRKCASGLCTDCPHGLWGVTVASASAFFFLGGEAGTFTAKCQTGATCHYGYWCGSGGLGGDLGVTASFGVIGGPNCNCAEDLAGWSGGVSGTIGEGIMGSAGGLASSNKCGGFTLGGGLGLGASVKANGCKTYLISCENIGYWGAPPMGAN